MRRQVSTVDAPRTKVGVLGSASNLTNAIVGAGIIGIPYSVKQSGLLVGSMLLVLVGALTDKSLRTVVELAARHPKLRGLGVRTYEDLVSVPFGRTGRMFILSSMLVLAYGAMVAYLLIVKDNVPTILGIVQDGGGDDVQGVTWRREGVMVLASLFVMVPLSLTRDISELACTSLVSVVADVVLVVIVCANAPVRQSLDEAGGIEAVLKEHWIDSGLFVGLGVLSTALACQQSSFLIAGTLSNPTANRWSQVTGLSLSTATALSLLFGVVGYLGFLGETQGDVLNNFDGDGDDATTSTRMFVKTARALLSVTMFLTYPMESFVARHVLSQLFFNGGLEDVVPSKDETTAKLIPEQQRTGSWRCPTFFKIGRREWVTLGLYVLCLVPALIVDDLGPVLSLTGSVGATGIAYIAPGLVYLGLNGDDLLSRIQAWLETRERQRKRQSNSNNNDREGDEIELPVVGDSTAKIAQQSPLGGTEAVDFGSVVTRIREFEGKPWWWWPVGMPLWLSIASTGATGCQEFFRDFHGEEEELGGGENATATSFRNFEDDEGVEDADHRDAYVAADDQVVSCCCTGDRGVSPSSSSTSSTKKCDYVYSAVSIVFGVVAAVAGVASNAYVQLTK